VFAVLTLAAFLIAPGPSSAKGLDVVEYYTAHGDVAVWQAVLAGFGIMFFLWFAGTFAAAMPSATAVLVSAGAMAAIYSIVLGAWDAVAETFKDVNIVDVPREGYGDAHVLYDVGIGGAHMASFANAAFVGATAAALVTSARLGRRLGAIGACLTVVWLINAPLQVFAGSDWSDAVGAIVFLSLLAWVFTLSVALFLALQREAAAEARAATPVVRAEAARHSSGTAG